MLWRCWLGGRKGHPACKNWVMGCWRGCLEQGADLHMSQLMPLPLTVSCFSKIRIGFTFLVPAHVGSPGKGPLNGYCCCVYMCSHSHSSAVSWWIKKGWGQWVIFSGWASSAFWHCRLDNRNDSKSAKTCWHHLPRISLDGWGGGHGSVQSNSS